MRGSQPTSCQPMKGWNMTGRNGVDFGWGAEPMGVQHPVIAGEVADQFDADNVAVIRLHLRGLITDSMRDAAFKKLTKKIGNEIRKALSDLPSQA